MDLTSRSSFLREKWDVATHAWRFDLTRHVWLVRKWGKMKENKEFYWKKEFLEKSPIKVSKSFFNDIFKFLFICQGQVDTWHHLRGLLEFSPFNNLEFGNKISISHDFQPFRTKRINFAWSCEISGAIAALAAFWTILHDCAKFSHIHAKQLPYLP